MKKLINSIFAYFGAKPPYSKVNYDQAVKHYSNLITIEQQAIDFVQNTLSAVNYRLRSELKRNGYDPAEVLAGKIAVKSVSVQSAKDARFKRTVYYADGFVVLRVNWKPNGFVFETNTADQANDNKKRLKAGGSAHFDVIRHENHEKHECEVDALANEKIIKAKANSN